MPDINLFPHPMHWYHLGSALWNVVLCNTSLSCKYCSNQYFYIVIRCKLCHIFLRNVDILKQANIQMEEQLPVKESVSPELIRGNSYKSDLCTAASLGINKMRKLVKMIKQMKMIKLVILSLRSVPGSHGN